MTKYKKDLIVLPWLCTFGDKSKLNLFGKVALSPLLLIICVTISTCEFLFTKG